MQFIDIKRQYKLHEEEINLAIQEVLESGQFILGTPVKKLEESLANYVGVKHCITASSGTDTLLLALMALGIQAGDEVITTPFTFISPPEMVALLGAKPVFVDIDPVTFNIDVEQIEAAITPRTKAIIPVSLFGQMPDFDKINALAERYGLAVIEDAAQSFGASQKGVMSCAAAKVGSTSFFPAKPFGCYGDGGALFTNDDDLGEKLRALMNHGMTRPRHHSHIGINGRLDTLQAAILNAKFPHFPAEVKARARLGARYTELLSDCCVTPVIQEGNTHVYAQYTIRVEDRAPIIESMQERNIPHAIHYTSCVHQQPAFAHLGYGPGSFPHAEQACKEVLCLPMHPWLTQDEQDQVIEAVHSASLALV